MLIQPVPLLEKDQDGNLRPYQPHSPSSSEPLLPTIPPRRSVSAPHLSSADSGGSNANGHANVNGNGDSTPRHGTAVRPPMARRDSFYSSYEDDRVSLEHIKMRDGSFESDVPVQAISELFNCHFTIVSQVR